jgi:hypothetical protein
MLLCHASNYKLDFLIYILQLVERGTLEFGTRTMVWWFLGPHEIFLTYMHTKQLLMAKIGITTFTNYKLIASIFSAKVIYIV